MPSIAEDVMQAILARLKTPSPVVTTTDGVRRSHRTTVPRDKAPAVHVVDGSDTPTPTKNDCRTDRTMGLTVSIFVRDDAGYEVADPYVVEVNARLHPAHATYAAYPHNAVLRQTRISRETDIADGDAIKVDLEYEFDYHTSGWALDA